MRPVSPRTKPRERASERTDSLSDARAFFFLFFFFVASFISCVFFFHYFFCFFGDKNVKICVCPFCVSLFWGGLSNTSGDKRIHSYETKVLSNPHKKTPSRVRHHHRARGHKDVL